MKELAKLCFLAILNTMVYAKETNIFMSEVFQIVLDPPMFNWTHEGMKNQFVYEASLLNAPDLPSWINYVYSDRHHAGFLYGVPPAKYDKDNVPLEVVALNKKNYETRVENLNLWISEKDNPALFEVHIKIDNLNVDDLFEHERSEGLKDIFRKQLWKESHKDLYITFLSSAVELGARKPLDPTEGEGVVIRLGSQLPFSTELIGLQEEIKPLWKVPSCPRDFKRTSVERYFRDAGFALDWCSFRLIDNNNSAMHQSKLKDSLVTSNLADDDFILDFNDRWESYATADVPKRNYFGLVAVSVMIPIIIFLVLAMVLSFLLCFQHDEIEDDESEIFFFNLFHICTDYYYNYLIFKRRSANLDMASSAPNTEYYQAVLHAESLNNFPTQVRLSPDLHSHTTSPNSTMGRGMHCRPSPPPYVRPKFKPEL
nr:unnamed protein product [Callosobruchus analis]